MELDITDFAKFADAEDYSASVAERGPDAGRVTWEAAKAAALNPTWVDYDGPRGSPTWLDTEAAQDAFRAHCKGFGAWSAEEIAGWSKQEMTALLIQMIADDMREGGLNEWEPDWAAYEADDSLCHRIYRGDDGRIYYYLGD